MIENSIFPYEQVFRTVESSLINYGARNRPVDAIRSDLDQYKLYASRTLNDELCYSALVSIIFYSGFRASTVSEKLETILGHFPNLQTVANYDEAHVERIAADPKMIRNKRKIRACIENARTMGKIVQRFGSFADYLKSFKPNESFENLLLLKEELESNFSYLGGITVYHLLTDLGLEVLKPDRVICRIFERLGLIEHEGQLLKTVIHGRKFAQATNLPIRYIDIVFVAYGQAKTIEFGLDQGICLTKPRCDVCDVTGFCHWYGKNNGSQPILGGATS